MNAKTRTWDYWYAEQVRAFARVRLRHFDASKSVVRSLEFELVDAQVR